MKRTRRKAVNVIAGMTLGVGPQNKLNWHKVMQVITDSRLKCQHFVIRGRNGKLVFIPHNFDQYVSIKTNRNTKIYSAKKLRSSS